MLPTLNQSFLIWTNATLARRPAEPLFSRASSGGLRAFDAEVIVDCVSVRRLINGFVMSGDSGRLESSRFI
jgi:hypothetical protein